jgi:phosphate transport system permease protein
MSSRKAIDLAFRWTTKIMVFATLAVLLLLLYQILRDGLHYLGLQFLTEFPSRKPDRAGALSAIVGSIYMMILVSGIAVPIGVGTALFMEEYLPKGRLYNIMQVNIASLAGMPSIVYGLVGLAIFVRTLALGRSVLAAALTLSLLVLPVIIVAAQGAIAAVPRQLREAGYAIGARKYQVVFGQVLPAAIPGIIMTGVILSLSRAIGESAPLILLGALSYVAFLPQNLMDGYTVLPVQIFNWAARPQPEFHQLAASGSIVLMALLFSMNLTAIIIRNRNQRYR